MPSGIVPSHAAHVFVPSRLLTFTPSLASHMLLLSSVLKRSFQLSGTSATHPSRCTPPARMTRFRNSGEVPSRGVPAAVGASAFAHSFPIIHGSLYNAAAFAHMVSLCTCVSTLSFFVLDCRHSHWIFLHVAFPFFELSDARSNQLPSTPTITSSSNCLMCSHHESCGRPEYLISASCLCTLPSRNLFSHLSSPILAMCPTYLSIRMSISSWTVRVPSLVRMSAWVIFPVMSFVLPPGPKKRDLSYPFTIFCICATSVGAGLLVSMPYSMDARTDDFSRHPFVLLLIFTLLIFFFSFCQTMLALDNLLFLSRLYPPFASR